MHVLLLYAGFTVLALVFEFPDVLRRSAAERLDLFLRQAAVVRPAYWLLTLTGFTQIVVAALVYQSLPARGRTVALLGLIFGVLTGLLQMLGFIRWAILVPYLAQAMGDQGLPDVTRQAVALVEGAFNRYAGMAVGEHAGNLSLFLWTLLVGVAFRGPAPVDRRLGAFGIALAPLALLLALEQLVVVPRALGALTAVAFPAWVVWLVVVAAALWRADPARRTGAPLTWRTLVWAGALYIVLAAPLALT